MLKVLIPWRTYASMADIPIEGLCAAGIRLVLLDMDNTLVPWHTTDISEKSLNWVEEAMKAGLQILLFSNNGPKRVSLLAKQCGIGFICHACKPYHKGIHQLKQQVSDYQPEHCVLIGDQYFTDILCGNRHGMKTILVAPLSTRENIWTQWMRKLEALFFKNAPSERNRN